jgi:hypothetical protein
MMKERDLLLLAVFEDSEVVLRQAGNVGAGMVSDDGGN